MNNKELYQILRERLLGEFKYSTPIEVLEKHGSQWFCDHELEDDKWGYKIMEGYVASLHEVYRSNATKENKSCDISIVQWHNNSGRTVATFRVKCQWKDKRINQEIAKALDEYRRLEKGVA